MTERHTSPDGQLTLIVMEDGGDLIVGLEGFPWHTHGDVLSTEYELSGTAGLDPESAVRRFVTDIIKNRAIIAVEATDTQVVDVWVTADPKKDLRYKPDNRNITFRYWDGSVWQAS